VSAGDVILPAVGDDRRLRQQHEQASGALWLLVVESLVWKMLLPRPARDFE
jgi:hypothetical protein